MSADSFNIQVSSCKQVVTHLLVHEKVMGSSLNNFKQCYSTYISFKGHSFKSQKPFN